jgi:iron complex transport system permease protein
MRRPSPERIVSLTLALMAVWCVTVLVAANVGSVPIPIGTSVQLFLNHLSGKTSSDTPLDVILFSVRLPRIMLASVAGAALALAGAAFQALLRNPLADPYVLGVSTGASTGTILCSILIGSAGGFTVGGGLAYAKPSAAFAGAILTVAFVYLVSAQSGGFNRSSHRLLLAGIVLASFLSSINVFLLSSTNQADLRGVFYWLIGDLSRPADATLYVIVPIVFIGFGILYTFSRSLNLIAMGEEDALILGVDVRRVKFGVYVSASLITGAVVSVSGPIAYIGLICPHMARMIFGADNRILLPAVFVFGAIFTVFADTLARTILSPAELPVGVITAICGAPLFIYLLRRKGANL